MLASGDYPDAVLFLSTLDQAYLNAVDQDIIIPVNEYIKDAPNIMEYTYDVSWDALKTKNDEKIYAIPRSSMARNDGFMIREDWLENVGLEMPADNSVTIEEFTEIAKRFTLNDPNRSGKNDTYGIIIAANSNKRLEPILVSSFGNIGWQKYQGEPYTYMHLTYSKDNGAYKEALAYTADLYKNGYIDPNAPTNTTSDITDKFFRGNIGGIIPGFSGHILGHERELQKNVPEGRINYIYIKNKEGEVKGGAFGTGFWGHWGITTAAKEPTDVVRFFDWILGDEGWDSMLRGKEGIDYKIEDGKKVAIDENKGVWKNMFMRRKGDFEFFTGSADWDDDMRNRVKPIVELGISSMVFSQDRGYTPPAARQISYVNYQTTMDEFVTKIVTGNAPVSDYDRALEGWYKNGGEAYIEQMNEYIKRINND